MIEWTEEVVYHRCSRHEPYLDSYSNEINARQVSQHVQDVGPHDAVVDDHLRVTFAELERLDVVALRDARAREIHASVVERDICM